MTQIVSPIAFLKALPETGQFFRLITTVFVVSSLVACAVTPTQPEATEPTIAEAPSTGLTIAANMYNSRNYPGAIREFGNVVTDDSASANDKRLAHLGKAMVYLSNDENWHSVDNAKLSLMSAGQVAPADGEEFAIETDLLMDAVSTVIGTESKYAVLMEKTSGSGAQIAQLQQERDALAAERDELLKEQKVLNEALEKLKQLTLGN